MGCEREKFQATFPPPSPLAPAFVRSLAEKVITISLPLAVCRHSPRVKLGELLMPFALRALLNVLVSTFVLFIFIFIFIVIVFNSSSTFSSSELIQLRLPKHPRTHTHTHIHTSSSCSPVTRIVNENTITKVAPPHFVQNFQHKLRNTNLQAF